MDLFEAVSWNDIDHVKFLLFKENLVDVNCLD